MYDVLRISNHPTIELQGIGLHSKKISDHKFFKTLFISQKIENYNLYDYSSNNYDLVIHNKCLKKRPSKITILKKLFFILIRTHILISFSLFSIKKAIGKNIKIVHIHSPMYILIAFWGWITRKKVYITYHGTDFLRIRKNIIYRIICKFFLRNACCVSEHMINELSKIHENIYYTPNGIDTNIFKNSKSNRGKIILAVGSLKKEKSFENLIYAFSNISKKHNDYKLHIAGEGILRISLENQIEELGLNKKVLLLGNLDIGDLVKKYNSSEYLFLSSSSEGFPKVILEALFCGCKVFGTNVGSIPSLLPKKYIMNNNEINTISEMLNYALSLNSYEVDLKKLKENYTWENVINIYRRIYEL